VKRSRAQFARTKEQGVVITLVAVFMLFVVGAMAVLAIDVVTFYTARSEAQLAADGAALAGARVLANSGMTSSNVGSVAANAALFCQTVANQVANSNSVGGQAPGTVTINCNTSTSQNNPTVTVRVQSNVPTFFARIWGSTQITVAASATAEAYNPSGLASGTTPPIPVATTCVKPWLLPNIDPTNPPNPIFNTTTGAIQNYNLLSGAPVGTVLQTACTNCTPVPAAAPWQFLPGDTATSFPPPPAASVTCSPAVGGFSSTPYELAEAGCVQTPIVCNAQLNVDTSNYFRRKQETARGVNCLAHTETSGGDTVDTTNNTPPPFEFLSGNDNPLVQVGTLASNTDVFVSDSIVTVPVFDSSRPPSQTVQVIGFVQLFLSPAGQQVPQFGVGRGQVSTTIINMVGCGTGATGTPTVIGNGPSAVPVRLITPP
jgi:Flp pilus assembly protein TadG